MAIKDIKYSKKFFSRTDNENISYPESPIYKDYQTISEKDEKIREEVISKYALYTKKGARYFGFDGNQQYIFKIYDEILGKNKKENVNYNTYISIKKAGESNKLANISDLETFLLEKGFKEKRWPKV